MDFGTKLERLLDERDLTQRQVSSDLHIAPTTLNGYIKGHREPDYGTLIRIAEYFEVSIDYLLGVTKVRKHPEHPLSMREGDLVGTYRSLQPEKQDLLIEQAHLFQKYDLRQKERIKKKQKQKSQTGVK